MRTAKPNVVAAERRIAGKKVPVVVVPRVHERGSLALFRSGVVSLSKGLRLTLRYFFNIRTTVTRQYPENREKLKLPERFRAVLKFKYVHTTQPVLRWSLPNDERPRVPAPLLRDWLRGYEEVDYHKCTGCKNCEVACPNASIRVVTRIGANGEDREVDRFIWRMDSCMYCNACVQACPFDAIEMGPEFENAVYDRRLLVFNLNRHAGPPASALLDEEDIDLRRTLVSPRARSGGPIPLNGAPLPNLRPLAVPPITDPAPAVPQETTV